MFVYRGETVCFNNFANSSFSNVPIISTIEMVYIFSNEKAFTNFSYHKSLKNTPEQKF